MYDLAIKNNNIKTYQLYFAVVVGCAVSIVVSVMLFLGAKQGKSLFFIPWLTEQIVALCVGVIQR